MALEITDANFEELVLKSDKPVLVDFWAEWCGPCRMVGPVVEELSTEYAGKAVSVPVTTGNPFSKVEVPKFLESVLSSIGPEYSTAVGLAIRLLK